jgi:hypothetical protein
MRTISRNDARGDDKIVMFDWRVNESDVINLIEVITSFDTPVEVFKIAECEDSDTYGFLIRRK